MEDVKWVIFFFSCRSPVYVVPVGSYTGERILEILLDPDIDQSNVSHNRPVGVTRSSTFVVDLEDIMKDDFGKWKYSGSHKKLYAAWQTAEGKLGCERIIPQQFFNKHFRAMSSTLYSLI